MKATELCEEIRSYCRTNADEAIVKKYSRYFKEGYDAYGVSREKYEEKIDLLLNDKRINMKLVLSASRHLIKSGKYEETSFAIRLLSTFSEEFTIATFDEIGKWFEIGITNWAHTDVICGLLIPTFFEKDIISLETLSDWRTAKNKYQRRAVPVAMLALLKTKDDYASLFDFIEPLMMDSERVVHQGLGWFLREAWKLKGKETETFLLKWKNDAARVIFQYEREKGDSMMRQLYVADREQWRDWLSTNHAAEAGIWLVFYKKETSRPTISYEAAVEESLCFGWIDSIIKKVDTARYARKFTPRSDKSEWSQLNKKRANKMIKQGRMTKVGLAKIKTAKKTGLWAKDARPQISLDIPPEFAKALARNKKAKENFDRLAPSYRRHYIGWITVAKRPETKKRRIDESIALLEEGKRLGLK